MAKLNSVKVTHVHHWTDRLFTFRTERDQTLRFKNGQFVMVGLEVDGKPLMRAYSIASPNYADYMEFYSIKVQDGPLTSRLQHLQVGDEVLLSIKPTGTLIDDHLLPGKHLYFLSTGTGLAPFLSLIQDPEIYEKYEKIILVHGCREVQDLTYQQLILEELPTNEFFGEDVKNQLIYYPTVTRESFKNQGRITDLLQHDALPKKLGLSPFSPENDRFMLCGSPQMLADCALSLKEQGFTESVRGHQAHYAIERAFVD